MADIRDFVIINMMLETSTTENLGVTNSLELVVPGVWSVGGMMTSGRKTFHMLSRIPYELPLFNV